MKYPSLLFTEKASGRTVSRQTFEDLKLTQLLSDNAAEAMRVLCRREDIPVRQELFRSLLSSSALKKAFAELAAKAEDISRLFAALKAAECVNERNYIFVSLYAAASEFSRAASEVKGAGTLLERFASFFKSVTEATRGNAERAAELRGRIREINDTVFIAEGDRLRIKAERSDGLCARLIGAARELGIAEPKMPVKCRMRPEARIINAAAALRPEDFASFADFYDRCSEEYDEAMLSYGYELNFYIEAAALFEKAEKAGLPLAWPEVSEEKIINVKSLRDITLLAKNEDSIVPNDVSFSDEEPFFFLTGANGGGKTTYLRALGIAVLFFLSGCPVTADSAEIWPFGCVFTHFPRDERFEGEGRFADERRRADEIMEAQKGNSLVLLNETFSTTNEQLGAECIDELSEKLYGSGSFALYITHQQCGMQSRLPCLAVVVDGEDGNRRTYRIRRALNTEGSYAADILRRYGLDRESLEKRFPRGRGRAQS